MSRIYEFGAILHFSMVSSSLSSYRLLDQTTPGPAFAPFLAQKHLYLQVQLIHAALEEINPLTQRKQKMRK